MALGSVRDMVAWFWKCRRVSWSWLRGQDMIKYAVGSLNGLIFTSCTQKAQRPVACAHVGEESGKHVTCQTSGAKA